MLTSATQRGGSCWSSGVLRVERSRGVDLFLRKGASPHAMHHDVSWSAISKTRKSSFKHGELANT